MTPPGFTLGANFSSDGRFIATSARGLSMSGEPIGLAAMHTITFAVPPRISGP